jgi:phosphoglycolate phosphatase
VAVDDVLAEQALMGYRERFAVTGLYENHVFDDVAETLKTLQQQGYRLFLATAKPEVYARQILEHFELLQYFVHPYGSELNGERTHKAELIAYIIEKEQLKPEECLMVGDREHDIFGARHNGIETIAVEYGYGADEELTAAKPKARIQSFAELLDHLN